MLQNDKCILTFGLSDEELEALRKKDIKVIEITNEMSEMTIKDIIYGLRILKYNSKLPKEKAILFNNYADDEIRLTIKSVREVVTGGVLAAVTPNSVEWTFEYLLNHLIEEREWFRNQQKGRVQSE